MNDQHTDAADRPAANPGPAPLGLRLALRLYPARYRAERGAEIAAVHADATADAGRWIRARESAGVAAYGLRVRSGLAADRPAGRLLAVLAPLAAVAALGGALPSIAQLLHHWLFDQAPAGNHDPNWQLMMTAHAVAYGLWLPVVAAALFGRWTAVRVLATLAALAAVAAWGTDMYALTAGMPGFPVQFDLSLLVQQCGPAVLWALLVLAAPPDLLARRPLLRRRPELPAALLVLALTGALTYFLNDNGTWKDAAVYQAIAVAGLSLSLLSLAALRWGRLLPAAVGLALLPPALMCGAIEAFVTVQFGSSVTFSYPAVLVGFVAGAVLLALLTAAAVRFLHRSPGTAGPAGA